MNYSADFPPEPKKYPKTKIYFVGHIVMILLIVVVVIQGFPIYISYLDKEKIRRRSASSPEWRSFHNLKNIGRAVVNYSSGAQSNLPVGASTNQAGYPLHGWMTTILPFIDEVELSKQIHYDKSWNDPDNQNVFRTNILVFINPVVGDIKTDAKEYALTHYTANSRLMGINKSYSLDEISAADGMTATIMLGEINSNFPAWGSTSNFRDPAKGLKGGPDQFGSPFKAVNVIFADGSGKSLSKDIDPQILKSISTPDGGERITEDDY
ncbi:DUF1559 family PulG-like putative transporter [Gimesia aquarii]|uniref:DUF1559 domain-containing protein n=1 Tax=Gimesia aquarii TaxID=2527964 RepID=A0A517VYJ4_9PLAN|nr:DUF1559 domain-containing protein [Gimesia aquarii]QDT98074.1 hypothetical protein V144x_35580 [Gimesia aquarii]